MQKQGFVYILASKPNGVLYIGVTSNLEQRLWQHKNPLHSQAKTPFTQKYNVTTLVYFEQCDSM